MNNVSMVGRLTKDIDLRYTPNGVAVGRFTLAVTRRYPNKQTNEREADFIQCQVWQKQAESAANYLKKGSQAAITGRWETGSFEGQDGKRNYTNTLVCEDIRFLDPASSRTEGSTGGQSNPSNTNTGSTPQTHHQRVEDDPFSNSSGPINVSDDDLPF